MRSIILTLGILFCVTLAQAITPFNGLLVDLDGKPIKGAKVYVKNPKHYARSDKEGKFGLSDIKSNDTLHIILKKTIFEVPVNSRTGMRITIDDLTASGPEDQELINTGTGYAKKRDYLGPSSTVTHEKLAATGHTDLIQAMRGLVPGVQVSGGNLRIRNSMSFNAPSDPLWVIDGSTSTDVPSLTVMEVEKVEILKDGAGYGTRGANGVIIVTLRK